MRKADVLVSVIVVTYNQENTIARTLGSIISQECHFRIEIIIGEDDSTDRTRSICVKYQQQYPEIIRLMPQSPNKGVAKNYYDCILASKGKYIADCAGDDFWIDNHKLEKEVAIIDSDESISLVHTNWNFYYENERQTLHNKYKYPDFTQKKNIGKRMLEAIMTQTDCPVIHLCTSLYRASIIKSAIEKNPELFYGDWGCEDLQLAFIMAYYGNIAYLPEYTLNYSCGHTSISHPNDEAKDFSFVKKTTDLSFRLSEMYDIHSHNTCIFFQKRVFSLMMHAFRSKQQELFRIAKACLTEWEIRPNTKTRIAIGVMSTSLTWNIAYLIRKIFVFTKRIILHFGNKKDFKMQTVWL